MPLAYHRAIVPKRELSHIPSCSHAQKWQSSSEVTILLNDELSSWSVRAPGCVYQPVANRVDGVRLVPLVSADISATQVRQGLPISECFSIQDQAALVRSLAASELAAQE